MPQPNKHSPGRTTGFAKFVRMIKGSNFQPFDNELPSHFADRLGTMYSKTVSVKHKKENGQFFTPAKIAQFMARLAKQSKEEVKILDPGCGTAILSICLVEAIVESNQSVNKIDLVVYETDVDIIEYTQSALNYLKSWLQLRNIKFSSTLIAKDFVLENKDCFEQESSLFNDSRTGVYDIVISNPPYFKIGKDDKRAIAAKSIVWGQPNIYSIFLMAAAKLLKEGGELIFITPRSFTAGNYFRSFREAFFSEIQIEHIHLFHSRTDAFNRDSVLQETLILKGKKQKLNGHRPDIVLSHSKGIRDLQEPVSTEFLATELIDFNTKQKMLYLPVSETEREVIRLFKSWEGSLQKYDMQISTGPVVSFRATEYLYKQHDNGCRILVPLYQLINTGKMRFQHPVYKKNKPQYIEFCEETKPLLLPNKDYIFLRRFSAKDDKSRLVATPYFADHSATEFIGVENHLNYIYRPKGYLEKEEILGLATLLNSKLFDTYFRTFNGNINVSATELREIPLPTLSDIKAIGRELIVKNSFTQLLVDELVNDYFMLEHLFAYEQS